jgi:flagellar protein FlbD
MVHVTRLNGEEIVLNTGLIETLEATPDTLITLVTGKRFMVREPLPLVVARITTYLREIGRSPLPALEALHGELPYVTDEQE